MSKKLFGLFLRWEDHDSGDEFICASFDQQKLRTAYEDHPLSKTYKLADSEHEIANLRMSIGWYFHIDEIEFRK